MPPKPPPRIIRKPSIPSSAPPPRAGPRIKPSNSPQPTSQSSPAPNAKSTPHTTLPRRISLTTNLPPWLLPTASLTLTFAGAALLFRDMFFCFDTVNGESMAPTLSPHARDRGERERVLIQRVSNAGVRIERGDIVTFWKPHEPNGISIKRVVGVEGDTVFPKRGYACDEGGNGKGKRVFVGGSDGLPDPNPDNLEDTEDSLVSTNSKDDGRRAGEGKIVVPHGHIWVEGDNWRRTFDSRDFGPVSVNLVDGKAIRVWRGWGGGMLAKIEDKRGGRDRREGSRVLSRGGEGELSREDLMRVFS